MANSNEPMRLTKAAKEFNVGVNTITDFLRKKGFNDDFNPNSKLSPEMVSLLVAEYHGEKEVKEKAHVKVFNSDRTPVSIDKDAEIFDEEADEKPSNELIIRDNTIRSTTSQPKDVIHPIADEKMAEPAPVVEKPAQPAPVQSVEKPVATKEPVIETPVAEPVKEPVPAPVAEKPASIVVEAPFEEKPIVQTPTVQTPTVQTPTVQTPTVQTPTVPKPPVVDEVVKAEEQPAPKAAEGNHPKVTGKIDLDQVNWATRPKPKSQEDKRKEKARKDEDRKKELDRIHAEQNRARKQQAQAAAAEAEAKRAVAKTPEPAENGDVPIETIRVKVDYAPGVKVIGTINLDSPKPKKSPEASSSDRKGSYNKDHAGGNKKPRPRVTKPGTPGTSGGANKPHQPNTPGGGPRFSKPGQVGGSGGGDRSYNRNQGNNKGGYKGNQKAPLVKKVEPTEDEIRKQIKDTLARLAPTGKSKTSKHRRDKRAAYTKVAEEELQKEMAHQKVIKVTEYVTANDLSIMINIPINQIIATCMNIGLFVSINQRLDAETLVLVAEEFGYQVQFVGVEATETIKTDIDDFDETDLMPRNPIVTVMGHVDHGKTKLLDYIRSANVVAGEAGGITQHIGAYEVRREDGRNITFLDTPGHEAFTAMRARGAKVTDIAIIVIAADDRVMPQTKEAINHAQAAGIPIVFAINKVDKPGANPEAVKTELSQMNILVEDWGGKYQSQEISALKGIGVEELLEKVLLEAEMLDLKATPKRRAVGSVIESSLDKGRGFVTKILVQNGTLRVGDLVLVGSSFGKVKAMFNERNQHVKEAGPSTPVLMLGLNSAPQAGDNFIVMTDEREAKAIATKREQLQREQSLRTQKHITLDEIGRRLAIGDFKELNVIVKGDVDGSVEALSDSLIKLSTSEVQLNVIHKSVGQISESDVLLASASDAIIVGFQVRPNMQARKLAENEGIQIKLYSIIYQAIEDIKAALEGMLSPEEEEKIVANVEVREVFKISKVGTIAGCMVLDGKLTRHTPIRIIRDGVVIHSGKLGSLKRFKDDVKEVTSGYECGLNVDNFNDIKEGDIVEGYEIVQTKRTL